MLSGSVSNKDIIEKAVNVAAGYVDKKEEVVTLLQLGQGAATNQVLLRVRFAEVSRSAMTELGVVVRRQRRQGRPVLRPLDDAAVRRAGVGRAGPLRVQRLPEPVLLRLEGTAGGGHQGAADKGLFQSLAEPNLVAESGKEASFLAGGEFPIPIAQGSGANIGISVMFKEFGIRLNFTPTVNGDRVHLKVRPGSQHARLQQRRRPGGLPHSGADHAPDRDRARAARTARRSRSPA